MTHSKCRVDHPFPYHVTRCWVRTSSPPPTVWILDCLFNPNFELNPQTLKRRHMELWSACLVLTHLHHHHHHPSLLQQHLEFRGSVLPFLSVVLFLWWAAFCPVQSNKELPFSSPFFDYLCRESSPFIQSTGPRLAALTTSQMSGIRTVPWPLLLRLLASPELLLFRISLPHLIILRTIWSEWTLSRWSPWPAAGCPLSA